jgi:hypothetical protein
MPTPYTIRTPSTGCWLADRTSAPAYPREEPVDASTMDGPSTATVTLMLHGHAVTVQLSDTNDIRLMGREEAMLEYYAEQQAEEDEKEE